MELDFYSWALGLFAMGTSKTENCRVLEESNKVKISF